MKQWEVKTELHDNEKEKIMVYALDEHGARRAVIEHLLDRNKFIKKFTDIAEIVA
jgi:hypothetical protein